MATKFGFGETFIDSMRFREQQDEQQRQMKLKLNEEMRQFNLLYGIKVDQQKTAEAELRERIRANKFDETYKQGMLTETQNMNKWEMGKPIKAGDFAGNPEQWENAYKTGSTKGLLNVNPSAPKADKWQKSYEPDPDRPGWKKVMATNLNTNEYKWTGGWEQETVPTGTASKEKRISENAGKLDKVKQNIKILTSGRENSAGWIWKTVNGKQEVTGIGSDGKRKTYTPAEYLKNVVEPAWNEGTQAGTQLMEDLGLGAEYSGAKGAIDNGADPKAIIKEINNTKEFTDAQKRHFINAIELYSLKNKGIEFAK